ncbi:MAG: CopD family protein [Desulfobacterales bacterium]|nr:CopD family protein [Desulfobacterales bacterium]
MRRFHRRLLWAAALLVSFLVFCGAAAGKEEYARRTGKGCIFCHVETTGGQLKSVGLAYIRNGHQYPIPERILERSEQLQRPLHRILRFVLGYLHLLAAVIFFGAIFYIHIFIKPGRLTGGIPRPERMLGLSCMAALTVTGIYLTWVRIDRWEQFFSSTFGIMLFVKILLFALMVGIGLTAVTVVHRRMKKEAKGGGAPDSSETSFHRFDGQDGRPARIVYENRIYDVTDSAKWKDGRHFGKHSAGQDLTEAMAGAPHGPEVLEKASFVGEAGQGASGEKGPGPGQRAFVVMAYTNLVIIFLILACISVWRWDFPVRFAVQAQEDAVTGKSCVECHRQKTAGIHEDWKNSIHARVDVDCYKCHRAVSDDMVLKTHLTHHSKPISAVVTPTVCAGCHPKQAEQYAGSKHAHTHEIMWKIDYWLNDGMNNAVERTTGCYSCHGTVVELTDGKPDPGSWPNVGVGRINPDGSRGSCSSCHTRHRFSIEEARKPEACDQCHLGPDHPQIEIYEESKHGTIYHAEKDRWKWRAENRPWRAGKDFRAPTCAACHMSSAPEVPETHDVTERLSWETQAPLTVRPSEFAAFPAATDWKTEREKMRKVCLQCHSSTWTDDHFHNLDAAVQHYNESYYKPAKQIVDDLYEKGLLSSDRYFDEPLEWEFYELWHHEGRRARMGAAMMAPDYAWWHGFYELKHRYAEIEKMADSLKEAGKGEKYRKVPGQFEKDKQ